VKVLNKKLVAGVAIVIIVLAATGYWFMLPSSVPSGETTAATSTGAQTFTSVARGGGTLTLGFSREPNSLDPTIALLGLPQFTGLKMVFEGLLISDLDGTLKPALAQSWERVDDVTYVLHLRHGVTFHDGTPFNASAAVFMDWYIKNGPGTQGRTDWNHTVKSVEAVDDYTVKYTLFQKTPTFLSDFLRVGATGSMVSPTAVKKWGDEFGTHPVGTGPFKFVQWVSGSSITFAANEKYWNGMPDLDSVVMRYIPDNGVRVLELQAGTVDVIDTPLTFATQLNNTQGIRVYAGMSDRQMQLSYVNTQPNPNYKSYFTDERVRQAINYAIDKNEIINVVLDGWAKPGIGAIRYKYAGYAPYLAKYNYDPVKAKQLLTDAGYPNGFSVELLTEGKDFRPYAEDTAVLIKSQLAKVGIAVTIKVVDGTTFSKLRFNQEFDLAMGGWRGNGLADTPQSILSRFLSSSAGPGSGQWNWENIRDPTLDSLINQLLQTPIEDVAAWKPLSDQIQKTVIDKAYECPVFDQLSVQAASSRVTGFTVDPTIGVTIWAPEIGIKVALSPAGSPSLSTAGNPIALFGANAAPDAFRMFSVFLKENQAFSATGPATAPI
jgi:peptide/nickel transport system substrate-binding protein